MEMRTVTRVLALLSSILLTLTTVPVQGGIRCRGKWRIHACFGGNGKRSMPSSNLPTLTSKLREARQLALKSAVQAGYDSPKTMSLLERLQQEIPTETSPTVSDKLLAREFAEWLQEDNLPREKPIEPILEPLENGMGDDFAVNDVTNDEADMTPDDMETVRDIITALTLKRALRTDGLRHGNMNSRDEML